ncbi:cellulase family glycosylhydrolase [Microtetraspora malaysiensis]|uniref:cellulase family glycosylhydrolase n=1 Tax=Microtetraspora malaysiensis TaxID=161358 RepID=UPI00083454AF|nr:cellulase family glycosylhydrolase [Microtetraspora malaysiensis]
MSTRFAAAAAALAALLISLLSFTAPAQAAVGLRVSGGKIYEANGSQFIMRGTSHAHTWFPSQTGSFAGIKSLGANTVRVVLSGGRWTANSASDVSDVIALCTQNRLICVLENHDTTGYGEQSGAYTLDQAVDYWIGLKSVLAGQENHVVINIGNEPYGNNNASAWTAATSNAISRMRAAGFQHMLMVDAPNWGQDWGFVMRDTAATVFAADPQKNTVFSIHMYGVFDTAAEITAYLQAFQTAGLPLVIGEFGNLHSDGDPDEDTIMAQAQARGIGYLGWSWSGNGGGVEYLDQVTNFNVSQLTSWGQRLFNGANGIRETAKEATVYSGVTPSPSPSASPSSSPSPSPSASPSPSPSPSASPTGGGRACSATYTVVGQWQDGFQGEVTVTAGGAPISGWTVKWTYADGQTVTQSWNATITSSGSSVTAKNVSYNGDLGAGASTTFGFLGSRNGPDGANGTPSLSCTAA